MDECSCVLEPEAQRHLLQIVRSTLASVLSGQPPPTITCPHPQLAALRGVFVTLRIGGLLRGCVGNVVAEEPLFLEVQEVAIAAATRDPRFPAMSQNEIEVATVQISVLTPPLAILRLEQIEIGRHGLLVTGGGRRAVMLPQVAVEQGWDSRTLLCETCAKAGIVAEEWDDRLRVCVFEAEVFGEGVQA